MVGGEEKKGKRQKAEHGTEKSRGERELHMHGQKWKATYRQTPNSVEGCLGKGLEISLPTLSWTSQPG